MSGFIATGGDVFGLYCEVEMLRFGVPNEFYVHKCIQSLRSNCWVDVPVGPGLKPALHGETAECVRVVCCGIEETEVYTVRREDVRFLDRGSKCRDLGGEEGTNGEGYDFACSLCGYCCDLPQPNFCPSCGARVVEGGDGDER